MSPKVRFSKKFKLTTYTQILKYIEYRWFIAEDPPSKSLALDKGNMKSLFKRAKASKMQENLGGAAIGECGLTRFLLRYWPMCG